MRSQQISRKDNALNGTAIRLPDQGVPVGMDRIQSRVQPFINAVLGVKNDQPACDGPRAALPA